MKLTASNYYSLEADNEFMSNSLYKKFIDCEAMAMAYLHGEWIDPPNDNFVMGNYLHSWNSNELEQFKEDHPEMFSSKGPTKGELKASFQFANRMIATLESDPFCMFVLQGEKEVIMTGEFAGTPWKIRIDSYDRAKRRLVDLKTTRNIYELVWSNERYAKVSFIEAYHYMTQLAIYAEIERLNAGSENYPEPLIVAVSKEDPPDKAIISLNDPDRIQKELADIEENMPRILAVKSGQEKPVGCGHCAYCRQVKKISNVIFYRELGD